MTDSEYIARLRAYLEKFSEGRRPTVPLVWNDGVLDREATAALPCYAGMGEVGGVGHE